MAHVDLDMLALRAIGDPLPDEAAAHVAACPSCGAEVESLSQVADLARALGPDDVLVEPPPQVWAGIAAAAGVDAPARPARDRLRWTLAAAAAGILAGGGAVLGWQIAADDDTRDVVAEAALDPLPDRQATGTASVVDAGTERLLVVDLDLAEAVDGYLEVWLLTPDVSGLVSLGVLTGGAAELVLPDGLDVAAFSVVDVSVEPFDGDPAHSGDSLVRGQLDLDDV